jgi:hypothetical protein
MFFNGSAHALLESFFISSFRTANGVEAGGGLKDNEANGTRGSGVEVEGEERKAASSVI